MAVDLRQNHYRFGRNTGSESTHGWLANEDTAISMPTGVTFLLRVVLQELGGTALANESGNWQYKINAGSWVTITTTSAGVKSVTPNTWANGADCTQRLTGTGTFVTNNDGCTTDGSSGSNNNDIAINGRTEQEIALQIVHAGVANGDTITFQRISDDTTITNNVTPTLTVIKGAVSGWNYAAAGVMTPDATYSYAYKKNVVEAREGALSFAAVVAYLQNAYNLAYSGVLSFAGVATNILKKFGVLEGSVTYEYTPAGGNPNYPESRDGALSFSSVLAFLQSVYHLAYNGVLSATGEISYLVKKLYQETRDGVLSFSGAISRLINNLTRAYDGVLSPSGTISRLINNLTRAYDGALSFTSTAISSFSKLYDETREGVLDFAGSLGRGLATFSRLMDGVKSFTGTISRVFSITKDYAGALNLSGIYSYIKKDSSIQLAGGRDGSGRMRLDYRWQPDKDMLDILRIVANIL